MVVANSKMAAWKMEPWLYMMSDDGYVYCAYCWALMPWQDARPMVDGRWVCNDQNLYYGKKGCRGFLWECEHPFEQWEHWRSNVTYPHGSRQRQRQVKAKAKATKDCVLFKPKQ